MAHFTQDDMRLISENLDVLLTGRPPGGDRLLLGGGGDGALGDAAALLAGVPPPAPLRPGRRTRSVEVPAALLGRPGSPHLHRVERPQLKQRGGGGGGRSALGSTQLERSCSSPLPLAMQRAQGLQHEEQLRQYGSAPSALQGGADASAAAVPTIVVAAAPPGCSRRLSSRDSEATAGVAGLPPTSPPDELDWLLGSRPAVVGGGGHPVGDAEAREFELLFSGASGAGGASGGFGFGSSLSIGVSSGRGSTTLPSLSPTGGLLFSPGRFGRR